MTKELQARLEKQSSPGKHITEESLPMATTNVYLLSSLDVPLRYEDDSRTNRTEALSLQLLGIQTLPGCQMKDMPFIYAR